ncbi:MAG: zinc-ribbon domain-containing protein, partial [Gemmobacter sp.]
MNTTDRAPCTSCATRHPPLKPGGGRSITCAPARQGLARAGGLARGHPSGGCRAMLIVCPNCAARYEVAALALPAQGREVECTACGHVWLHLPPPDARRAASAAPPPPS